MTDRLSPLRQAALRRRLVPITLNYVARSIPYYCDLFEGRASRLQLADFPFITKDFKDKNAHRLVNLDHRFGPLRAAGSMLGCLPPPRELA